MKAGEVIDFLQRRMGNACTRAQYLSEISIAHKDILCQGNVPFMLRRGDTYLTTVSDVYEYEVNARTVTRVFQRESPTNVFGYGLLGTGVANTFRRGSKLVEEYDISFDVSESISPDHTCTIYFPTDQNLGDTTDKYLLQVYDWPTEIASEFDTLQIPDQWITSVLYYVVKKGLEEGMYGVDIYSSEDYLKMVGKMNTSQQNQSSMSRAQRKMRF